MLSVVSNFDQRRAPQESRMMPEPVDASWKGGNQPLSGCWEITPEGNLVGQLINNIFSSL
jgi:hypothetical protein